MHFGLAPQEVQDLDDETFCELAARAYFLEDRQVLAVKRGVMMAVAEMFKK